MQRMNIFKKITFVAFCYASAVKLQEDLGLPTEKLICLHIECIEMLKHCHDIVLTIKFVRFCYASALTLQEYLGLPTEKLICLYEECTEMAKHCHDITTMVFSFVQFVLLSNSIGRHVDSLRCLKEILSSALVTPEAELIVHQYLSHTYTELKEYDNVVFHAKKTIEIAKDIDSTESEMKAYEYIGAAYKGMHKYEDTILYALKVLDYAMKTNDKKAMMTTYLELGTTHLALYHLQEAADCGKKCIDIARETEYRSGEVLANLLMGRVHEALSDYDSAMIYGKKCIELAMTIGNKQAEAHAYSLLGSTYYSLEKYDDAISNCNKCLRMYTDKEDNDKKAADASAYFTLGQVNMSLEKHDEAIQNLKRCIDIVEGTGIKNEARLRACNYLGEIYEVLEQYSDAVHYYKKCIDMAQENSDKKREAEACILLSSLYMKLHEKDNVIQYCKKCIDLAQETGDKKREAEACILLSSLYMKLDEKDNVIQYCKKGIDLAQETGDKITKMAGHHLLAKVYMSLTQLNDVSLNIDAGMAIATELGRKKAKDKFQEILSELYLTVGLHDKACSDLPFLKELLDVPTCSEDELLEDLDQAAKKGNRKKETKAFIKLYHFYQSKKEHEKAINCLKQVKAINLDCSKNLVFFLEFGRLYQKIGQNDMALSSFIEGLPTAESCSNNTLRSHFYYGIGDLLFSLNRELTLAECCLRKAIRCFEAIFSTLGSHDEFKISIFDHYIHSYKILAILLIKGEQIKEALLVLDRCRSRALKDLMISNFKMEKEESDEEHLEFSDAVSLVSSKSLSILYYSLCFDAFLNFFLGDETTLLFSILPNAFLSNSDFSQIDVDKLFDEMGVRAVVNCEDRSLDKKQDIKQEQTRGIEEYKRLSQSTASLLNLDSKLRGKSDENSTKTFGTTLESLFCFLGCDKILSSKQDEVVIIPEGPLYQVPFPALRDPSTGKYLSETKRIRLAPSLATLKHFEDFPTDRTSNTKPLIIGDPLVGKVMMDGEEKDIEPLPGAREEAAEISLILNTPALFTLHATKPAVIKRLQEGASVIHIAAHGNLSKATIVLAPSPEIRATKIPDEEDYMLTMADVQQAKVRAQLVVLSCCHSGRGEIRAEGVVGMCRAFLASGARAVVASLWAIDDDATFEFMQRFYLSLKDGKSASTSLQLAMKEMRNSTSYSEPKYWAPFFLMGDDVTLQL